MGRPKKYATDEERRLAINARARLKYDSEKEKLRSEQRREQKKAHGKAYYEANKERLLKQCKEYRENKKDKIKEYNAAYREKNKDSIRKKKREYGISAKNNNELKKNRAACQLNVCRKAREKIADWYAAKVLKINVSECSEELIEMKRQQMLVARQIRSLSKLLKETENG